MNSHLTNALRANLVPHLKEDGFIGSGFCFRKIQSNLVLVLAIQNFGERNAFAINLSAHPILIPDLTGAPVNPKTISYASCELRSRLSESGIDQWWSYGTTAESCAEAAIEAAQVYIRFGRPRILKFLSPNYSLLSITPEDVISGQFDSCGFSASSFRINLLLARLHSLNSNPSLAARFAEAGLFTPRIDPSLREELLRLSQSPNHSMQPTVPLRGPAADIDR